MSQAYQRCRGRGETQPDPAARRALWTARRPRGIPSLLCGQNAQSRRSTCTRLLLAMTHCAGAPWIRQRPPGSVHANWCRGCPGWRPAAPRRDGRRIARAESVRGGGKRPGLGGRRWCSTNRLCCRFKICQGPRARTIRGLDGSVSWVGSSNTARSCTVTCTA